MVGKPVWQDSKKMAIVGFIFTIPALVLVAGGVLYSLNLPQLNQVLESVGFFKLAHPIIILGGATLGVLLNLLPIVRIQFEDGVITNTVILRNHVLNWGYLLLTGGVLGMIFLYVLAENFQIFKLIM